MHLKLQLETRCSSLSKGQTSHRGGNMQEN